MRFYAWCFLGSWDRFWSRVFVVLILGLLTVQEHWLFFGFWAGWKSETSALPPFPFGVQSGVRMGNGAARRAQCNAQRNAGYVRTPVNIFPNDL
jgi:hypothetical protein